MTLQKLKEILRNGPYAWPGGYPLFFVMRDGNVLSFDAVRTNFRLAISDPGHWMPEAYDINWEDPDLYCDHTGDRIPSAYAED